MEVEKYEKWLRQAYQTAPIGFCLFDAELRYQHINDWLASINGLSVEEHLGRSISEVLPEVSAEVELVLRGVMESGEPVLDGVVEAETPASPHQKRTFQHSYHAIESDEGVVVGVSCIVQDITRRKEAEDALVEANKQLEDRVRSRSDELLQSERRQSDLLESIQAVPWEADATTYQFTYVGPQAVGLLGFPSQQWLESDFWSLHIHPEDRTFAVDYCLQSAKSKTDFAFEYRMITADGRTVWIHDIVNVAFEAGAPKMLRGIMIDITERRNAEKSLEVSEERFRSLSNDVLENSAVGIFILDKEFHIVWINRSIEQQFGVKRDEIIGKDKRTLIHRHIQHIFDDPEGFRDRVLATYDNNTYAEHFECHVLAANDREDRWLEHSSQPITSGLYKGGRVEYYTDISERMQVESELRAHRNTLRALAQRLLSAQEDERRRLARELHDDLSQRLAAIGIDSMRLERNVRAVSDSCADEVAALSGRIRQISADIHQISHQLHPSILDELGLVKAMKGDCDAFTRRTGISIAFTAPGEPAGLDKSTELAVFRIMQECLQNMAKHSRAVSGSVEFAVDDDEIRFSVRDTGIGFDLSEERHERGVGMTSMRERAELLGGNISIESVIGQGTTVNVTIPRRGITS